MKKHSVTQVVIPCRGSYMHVIKPYSFDVGTPEKYSMTLLIPKTDTKTIEKIKTAIKAAIEEGKSKLAKAGGGIPKNLKQPLRDADEEGMEDPSYEGMMFINATSRTRPQIVDRKVQPITDPEEIYSGCYCNVSVNFYAFNVGPNRGIAAGLNNIQKVKDGERFAGGPSAEDDFEALPDDDEADDDIFG